MNNPAKILIVDDVPDTVEILTRQLTKEGYDVLKCYNGKESLEMVKEHNPDLVLMDIMMPDMDGFQATKILKEKEAVSGFLPIILVTATKDDSKSIVRGLQAGANDYITLPCEREIILARVRSMLRIKHLHDELNQTNMTKLLFLAGMAHELKTPTTAIQGFVNLLLEDKAITKSQKRDLKHIQANVNKLIHFLNEVLDLSRIITGKIKLESEKFQLEPFIESCINSVKQNLKNGNVKLISRIDKDIPALNTNMNSLRQIMDNFLSNAVKFTKKGEITITCNMDDKGMVNISVSDTGIGIKKELLPYIFEEFKHTDSITKPEYQGSGLGLSISKRLANLLGGDIKVESRAHSGAPRETGSGTGKGSKFTLIFPPKLEQENKY